jgi:hypothetical protein
MTPVIIINSPPKPCSLAEIYRLVAAHGKTLKLRKQYSDYLESHLKDCQRCKDYADYLLHKSERGRYDPR